MPRSSHERLPLAVVLPIAVFLIAVGVIAVLYRYAQDRNARLVDNESRALLHQAVMRVEERVDRVLTALSAARARDMRGWGSFGGSEGFTTALVTGAPEILTISRIAGDDALELLYPAEAPAWFDDLRGGLTAVPWRAHALGGSQVVVSPPVRLTQDQRGLAAYVPTQGPGAAGPIINIVFEIDSLLDRVDEVLDGRYSSLLRYVGEDPAHVSIVARDPSEARSMAADPKLLTRPFTVGDQPWRVEISPKLGGVGGGSFLHNELFLVLGLLAGIGLSLLTRQHYLGPDPPLQARRHHHLRQRALRPVPRSQRGVPHRSQPLRPLPGQAPRRALTRHRRRACRRDDDDRAALAERRGRHALAALERTRSAGA